MCDNVTPPFLSAQTVLRQASERSYNQSSTPQRHTRVPLHMPTHTRLHVLLLEQIQVLIFALKVACIVSESACSLC